MEDEEDLWWIPFSLGAGAAPPPELLHLSRTPLRHRDSARYRNPGSPLINPLHYAATIDAPRSLPSGLSVHNLGSSTLPPARTDESNSSEQPQDSGSSLSSAKSPSKPTGFVFGRGLGFAGQVFGLFSTTRSCLVGIEEKRVLKSFPFMTDFVRRLVTRVMHLDSTKGGPAFRFYLDEHDANTYLKRLNMNDMEIGSVPLHLAYKFFKEKPYLFKFLPAKKQVQLAKQVIKRTQGKTAAGYFQGVPIFTSENLSVLVVGPDSVRWFRPYFFKKEELDGVIQSSMEHHYQSLIINRRTQRHSQMSDLPPDMGEDDMDMLESQDVQDFMEDMDEWGPFLESLMAKAAQVYVQDALDRAVFGNKWCRKAAGIQPRFPISVESFERRVVADGSSELDAPAPARKATAAGAAPQQSNWLMDKFGLDLKREAEAPHLTVVAGIAGSTPDQVMKAATSAIEQAKDMIENNKMPLENLYIADLGGPNMWAHRPPLQNEHA